MKTIIAIRPKALVTVLLLGWVAANQATASDLRVPADYPTIQAAVDAAQTNDTIRIASGVYTEQVRIRTNKLTLIGQPGTILRAFDQMSPIQGNNACYIQ
jgi:pectin methylesterase-like acyl-CoA thioesterase